MLAEMEPAEMDERLALEWMDGGDPYAAIITVLVRGFTVLCRSWGADVTPEEFDPRPDVTGTVNKRTSTAGPPIASPNQAAAIAAMSLGPPNRRDK